MGVKGLKSFVDNLRPSLGADVELAGDPVLVDGHSLTYHLFFTPNDNWILGGEYETFRRDVAAFLATLCAACQPHRPIVLMDGVPPLSKHSERMKRAAEKGARSLAATQAIARGSGASLDSLRVLPPWALPTFINTVRECPHVDVFVCDGEADQALAIAANVVKGVVLSNDSDFHIFDIKKGYIPLSTLRMSEGRMLGTLHKAADLAAYLNVPTDMLRLFATLCGNDYVDEDITQAMQSNVISSLLMNESLPLLPEAMQSALGQQYRSARAFISTAKFCSQHLTVEKGLAAALELLGASMRQRAEQGWRVSLGQYQLTQENTLEGVLDGMAQRNGTDHVSAEVCGRYRTGQLHCKLLEVCARKAFWGDAFLSDPTQKSAWAASQPLREHLYAICVGPGAQVKEYIVRAGQHVSAREVLAASTQLSLESASGETRKKRLGVLCDMLGVSDGVRAQLGTWPRRYILPVLTLHYLADEQHSGAQLTRPEARALLTTMLCPHAATCNAPSSTTPRATHVYTQLQLTLLIVCMLNQAIACPLPDVDVCGLLSGVQAHHFLQTKRSKDVPACPECAADPEASKAFARMMPHLPPSSAAVKSARKRPIDAEHERRSGTMYDVLMQ